MTAIATASTKNCTNRTISRVKRKKIATIPTMPRNSGPKSVCRYVTSPLLLSATGTAVASMCDAIVTPGVVSAAAGAAREGGWSWRRPLLRDGGPDPPDEPRLAVPDYRHGVRHVDPGRPDRRGGGRMPGLAASPVRGRARGLTG